MINFNEKIVNNASFIVKNPFLILALLRNYFLLILKKKPLRTVELAITYECPYKCAYCSATAFSDDTKKELTLQNYKDIIEDCIDEGAVHFLITGGEPLISEKLEPLVKYIKKRKRICTLATNGLLITKEKIELLKDIGIDLVQVSIDSVKESKHDSFRKYPGAYNKAINCIKGLKKSGVVTMINFIVRKANLPELPKLLSLSRAMGVGINLGFSSPVGKWQGKTKVMLNDEEWKVVDYYLNKKGVRWCGYTTYNKVGCSAGTEKIYISPYGDVTPCPLVPIKFGNLKYTSLKDILKNMRNNKYFNNIHPRCLPASNKKFINQLNKSKQILL